MQAMKEPELTRLLALETPHCRRQDRPTGQRQHHDATGDRASHAWRLAARLRRVLLVRRRVGPGDPGALHHLDRTSVPVPSRRHLLLEPLSAQRYQAVSQRLRKALARLTVPASERRTRLEALGDARRVETCDRRTARGVVTVHLPQESTKRHQRGEDAVAGLDTFLAEEVDDVLDRQHCAAREGAILQEPLEEVLSLRQGSTSDSMPHSRPPVD